MAAAAAAVSALGSQAEGAAWTRAPGETFLSATVGWFGTDDGGYDEATAAVYAERGIREGVTLGATADITRPLGENSGESLDLGLAGFARFRLWQGAAGDPFSVQLGYGAPIGDALGAAPAQTRDEPAAEVRALYGRGFSTGWGDSFVNAEGGLRFRLEDSADEVRLDLTAGLRPAEDWLLMLQSFTTVGLGNEDPGGDDYSVTKLAPSVGYRLRPGLTALVGVERDVAGRNVDLGTRLKFSVWTEF